MAIVTKRLVHIGIGSICYHLYIKNIDSYHSIDNTNCYNSDYIGGIVQCDSNTNTSTNTNTNTNNSKLYNKVNKSKVKNNDSNNNNNNVIYDIAIIGGGIVGLAVAQACASKLKKSIVIIEKEDCVAAGYVYIYVYMYYFATI